MNEWINIQKQTKIQTKLFVCIVAKNKTIQLPIVPLFFEYKKTFWRI